MEKFTISIDMELEEIKKAYRMFYGEKEKVTKKDLTTWISQLAHADIEATLTNE